MRIYDQPDDDLSIVYSVVHVIFWNNTLGWLYLYNKIGVNKYNATAWFMLNNLHCSLLLNTKTFFFIYLINN